MTRQLFEIKFCGKTIHLNEVIAEDEMTYPLDYLSEWLEKSRFVIPEEGIEFSVSGPNLPWAVFAFKVYDHLTITLPIHSEQDTYRNTQHLWLMHPEGRRNNWYIQYEYDFGPVEVVPGMNGHRGVSNSGAMLLDIDSAKLLDGFLRRQYESRMSRIRFKEI